jgi:cytochrome P450
MPEPPGPRGAALVSALNDWRKNGLLAAFEHLAQRYGDIVCTKFPGRPVYLLNHPDHIRHVLIDNRGGYLKSKGDRHGQRYFSDAMQLSNGDKTRRLRRTINPVFQQTRATSDYCAAVVEETRAATGRWTAGLRPTMMHDLMELALAVALRIHFGMNPDAGTGELAALFREANGLLSSGMPPAWIPLAANRRYRAVMDELDRNVYSQIKARRASGATGPDLLSCFVSLPGDGLTDREIRNELLSMMAAAYGTTGIVLYQMMRQVASHAAVDDLLHGEATRALGGRPATHEDLVDLPYSEQVVKESLRTAPPAGVLMRIVAAEDEIGGWRIRGGSRLFISPWVTHRDPRWFDEPLRFKPERWTPDFERTLPPCAYLAFGRGSRMCIAGAMSTVILRLMLVTIIQRFQLRAGVPQPQAEGPRPFEPAGNLAVVLEDRDTVHSAAR